MAIITGENAIIWFGDNKSQTLFGTSDFSITFDRGMVEQPLVGQQGNYFMNGALTIGGSFTNCRFGASGNSDFLDSIMNGTIVAISGAIDGSASLNWFFTSSQITGYDVTVGDASTITEATIDFTVMDPKNITYNSTTHKVGDN
jgi:hypothetical protein